MPATALRHPEVEEIVLPVSPAPDTSLPSDSSADPHNANPHNLEWRTVAPLVDNYTGAEKVVDRATARRRSRRHKPFSLHGIGWPATLVLLELMLLVGLYTRDLKMLRQEDKLKKEIQQTQLLIANSQNELASYKSSPLLAQWAKQLGYRPIEAGDFDDVTSNAPLPKPVKAATP